MILPESKPDTASQSQTAPYTLRQLILYALKLGTMGFGGPVALVGYMYRDLVEKRNWFSEDDYKEGLTLCELAPGPLAAQMAIYLGFVHYRILGATLVGLAFILPSFLMVVGLGWAYKIYGSLPWLQPVFRSMGASVIGIIAFSAYKLTAKTVGKDWLLWLIYLAIAAITVITESEKVWLFIAAGILIWLVKAPPKIRWSKTTKIVVVPIAISVLSAANTSILWRLAVFFAKAGAFVFGSGLAIVPFLYGGVVKEYHWLTDNQFLDAVAVAMITPGPVVITAGFIGFLVAGFLGSIVAALATFFPCYLFTIIPAPYFRKYGHRPDIAAFVSGVTAAAIGAISGAVVILGRKSITSLPAALLAVITLGMLRWTKKIPEPIIILVVTAIGLLFKL